MTKNFQWKQGREKNRNGKKRKARQNNGDEIMGKISRQEQNKKRIKTGRKRKKKRKKRKFRNLIARCVLV